MANTILETSPLSIHYWLRAVSAGCQSAVPGYMEAGFLGKPPPSPTSTWQPTTTTGDTHGGGCVVCLFCPSQVHSRSFHVHQAEPIAATAPLETRQPEASPSASDRDRTDQRNAHTQSDTGKRDVAVGGTRRSCEVMSCVWRSVE